METLVTVVHYGVCIFLIGVILLQAGKGADIGAAFGAGGSNTVFGARGPATFLNKMTIGAAIIFLLTSITLAQMAKQDAGSSVVDSLPAQTTPAVTDVAPAAAEKPAVAPAEAPKK
jgi:preprotein translocase subunit SecG